MSSGRKDTLTRVIQSAILNNARFKIKVGDAVTPPWWILPETDRPALSWDETVDPCNAADALTFHQDGTYYVIPLRSIKFVGVAE